MTTDCMRSARSPRLLAIAGNAVLTMVASSVCMKKLADTNQSNGRNARCGVISATGAFGLVSELDQLLDQAVAVITLDFDAAVPDRATGATQLLKTSAQRL